jgi:uncharacterized protein
MSTRLSIRELVARVSLFVLLAVIAYFAVGTILALVMTTPQTHHRPEAAEFKEAFESPTISSRDGLKLAGWFIPAANSERVVIMVHGVNTCRACELDGRFVEMAEGLHAAGLNVLMLDLRAHGQSEGDHTTFGDQERWDVLGAMDWLHQRGYSQIGVLGVSLGAVTAVMAAADPQGGDGIRALVLDSPFADFRAVLEANFTKTTYLPDWLLPGALSMAHLLLKSDLDTHPVDKLPLIHAPIMLIFSQRDDPVPASQIKAVIASRPDALLWVVPDGGHARIYNAHPQEYLARVSDFLSSSLR